MIFFAQGKKNALALKLAVSIKVMSKDELSLLSTEDRKKPYDCQSKCDSLSRTFITKVITVLLYKTKTDLFVSIYCINLKADT
jgi:hypothetical protein